VTTVTERLVGRLLALAQVIIAILLDPKLNGLLLNFEVLKLRKEGEYGGCMIMIMHEVAPLTLCVPSQRGWLFDFPQ
jgi:hypothetical protein